MVKSKLLNASRRLTRVISTSLFAFLEIPSHSPCIEGRLCTTKNCKYT